MSRETFILSMVEAMSREAPLFVQVENEGPDFLQTDPSYIRAYSLGSEKVPKVTYAVSNDGYGIGAFSFGDSTQVVTLKQTSYIGAKI